MQPGSFASPSGEWVLFVDPSDPQARGPAQYTMALAGAEVWHREYPWTLLAPRVTDQGEVVGHAHDHGMQGHGIGRRIDEAPFGHVVMAVLNADGSLRLEHKVLRTLAERFGAQPAPRVGDMDLSEQDDLLAYLLLHESPDGSGAEIYQYQLSSARLLGRLELHDRLPVAARLLPGGEHLALQLRAWHQGAWTASWRIRSLSDASLVTDFLPGSSESHGATIPEDAYRVSFPTLDWPPLTREHFFAHAGDGSYRHWIGELIASDDGPEHADHELIAELDLKRLGTISLRDPDSEERAKYIYQDFHFDADELIHAHLSVEDPFNEVGTRQLVRVMTQQGDVISETPIDLSLSFEAIVTPVGGTELVLRADTNRTSNYSQKLFRLNLETGELAPLPIEHDSIVAALRVDDGFVVLAEFHARHGSRHELLRYDGEGNVVWRIERADRQQHDKLRGDAGIALSASREIGVLSTSGFIQVFDAKGLWLRTIEIDKALGQSYPTQIATTHEGWLIGDALGATPWIRVSLDGSSASGLDLRFENAVPYAGVLRESPQGELWAISGERLMRLDAHGRIVESFGPSPSRTSPSEIENIVVGPGPRIYALDSVSRHVFAYTLDGQLAAVMKPDPDDFPLSVSTDDIKVSAARNGRVFMHARSISARRGPLEFLLDGTRLGWRGHPQQEQAPSFANFLASPDGDGGWLKGYRKASRVGNDGEIRAEITRSADNRWLPTMKEVRVNVDGSLAILANNGVSLYEQNGARLAWIPITGSPRRLGIGNDVLGVFATDPATLLLYRRDGEPLGRVLLQDDDWPMILFPPGREEVWLWYRGFEIQRYALPGW